jgi:hypothetical protein
MSPIKVFPTSYVKPWFVTDTDTNMDANMDADVATTEDNMSKNGDINGHGDVETTATTKHVGIPDVVTFIATSNKKASARVPKPRANVAFMKTTTAQLMLDEPGLRKADYQQKARVMWRDHKAAKRAAKPRAPTAYNMYIKNKIVELKAMYPGKVHQEYFMDAIEAYRQMRKEQVPTSVPALTPLTQITLADVTKIHVDILNKLTSPDAMTAVAMPRTP